MNQSFTKVMILMTVIFMDLLAGTEFDLFVPSFPELQKVFGVSPFWIEALLSVNFIGYCISLFFVGGLADRYGRKPIILLGLVTFIIGSVLCLLTLSYPLFLLGRFLQGIGIAAPAILSFLIISDTYPLKKQQFLMSMLNAAMNASAALAPVVGSYITLYFQWEGNFIALFILGMMTLLMSILFIPKYKLPEHRETISWRGYMPIFQSKPLMLLIIYMLVMFVPYWIFVGMSPLLYIKDLGVSLAHFGYYQGSFALIFALGSLLFGLIINSFKQVNLLRFSSQIFIVSFVSLLFVTLFNDTNPLLITLAFIPFIIGQIIPSNILYPVCLNLMPEAKGRVSALMQGGRLIFTALSLQLAGYFYNGSFQSIGLIISSIILLGVVILFFVNNNTRLMLELKE